MANLFTDCTTFIHSSEFLKKSIMNRDCFGPCISTFNPLTLFSDGREIGDV